MKIILTYFLIITHFCVFAQLSHKNKKWLKAVVNIETENLIYPNYYMDSVVDVSTRSGFSKTQMDSVVKSLLRTNIMTGTAIYVEYRHRKYLLTAKHVINSIASIQQKEYENKTGINKWDTLDAVDQRVSVRTPYNFWYEKKNYNTLAVYNNNFIHFPPPFFFISDSTGDGIGVISLQDANYKKLDTLLQKDGYSPINLEKAINKKRIKVLDNVYAIGFPEGVSIIYQLLPKQGIVLPQLPHIVHSFIVKGEIAMYDPHIQHYYIDMTILPGNSGSPIVKRGKLIGIVSGINKYHVIKEENGIDQNTDLFGIGHLVNIVNISLLIPQLKKYQRLVEDKMIAAEK